MPKVFSWNGYRFHFFANEGDPREPMHIDVSRAGAKAKFWLFPEVELIPGTVYLFLVSYAAIPEFRGQYTYYL